MARTREALDEQGHFARSEADDQQTNQLILLDEENQRHHSRRITEIIREHINKSKYKGDYHFRAAESWGATGDFIPGFDQGEPPTNYENLH
jgi:hypothetical protein